MDDKMRKLLAGYVDGELTEEERAAFERELENNAELQAELEEFRKLKEVTGMVRYADLPDEVWENYWHSLYRRIERGVGWILFSLGAILMLGFGLYHVLSEFYRNPEISVLLKIGVTTLGGGVVILLVSFIRERLFAFYRDRYREVMK